MVAFVGVFTALVIILAAGCMIAERTMGTHSVLKDEPRLSRPACNPPLWNRVGLATSGLVSPNGGTSSQRAVQKPYPLWRMLSQMAR
jgi:uncharacterized protein YneF (UPF0154 family)